jgi:hypothetical protein
VPGSNIRSAPVRSAQSPSIGPYIEMSMGDLKRLYETRH